MADPKSIAGEVEGDYSVVKVQLAGGGKDEKPSRPTKGTQLVWGGTDASSPWGHLAALIEKAGGSVNYTYVHAADLKAPLLEVKDEEVTTSDEPAEDVKPPPQQQEKTGGEPDQKKSHSTGGAEGHGPLFDGGVDFQFAGNTARVWAHPHAFMSGPLPLVIALHGINGKSHKLHPSLDEH